MYVTRLKIDSDNTIIVIARYSVRMYWIDLLRVMCFVRKIGLVVTADLTLNSENVLMDV